MNKNLPRWVYASVTKHFDSKKDTLQLRFEGDDRTKLKNDALELRMDGPNKRQYDKSVEYYDIYINILVISIRDEKDAHKVQRQTGIAAAAFVNSIPVYRYGTATEDDKTLLGCLVLEGEVIITNFGAVEGSPNLLYSTVEGGYCLTLT